MARVSPGGEASEQKPLWKRVLWCIFFPFILLWHSIAIYFFPCIRVYLERVFGPCLLSIGQILCCCCFCRCWKNKEVCVLCEFEDRSFPPDVSSLGNWNNRSTSELASKIEWKRAASMGAGKDKARLFSGGTTPQDLVQGQLGDCWLLAALACLTERSGAVERCFVTRQRNVRGMYTLQLFDGKRKRWERVVVDDYIPTEGGKPLFAKPNGDELWVLILEKAVAKFCGDYHALDGGLVTWAFELMTGDTVHHFDRERNGTWNKYEMRHSRDEQNRKRVGYYKVEPAEQYPDSNMFEIMKEYLRIHSVLGASSTQGTSDHAAHSREGICQGHAYSVIAAKQVASTQLLKLRNPWGAFEWTGDWSDASPLWEQHANVSRECSHQVGAKDDGVFWMEMKDFARHFDQVDVCHRSTGLGDLQLDVREEEGCIGPCKGCLFGCCGYWCLCRGCVALCCASESSSETVKVHQGCCCF